MDVHLLGDWISVFFSVIILDGCLLCPVSFWLLGKLLITKMDHSELSRSSVFMFICMYSCFAVTNIHGISRGHEINGFSV